jgi:hypothetical protein
MAVASGELGYERCRWRITSWRVAHKLSGRRHALLTQEGVPLPEKGSANLDSCGQTADVTAVNADHEARGRKLLRWR